MSAFYLQTQFFNKFITWPVKGPVQPWLTRNELRSFSRNRLKNDIGRQESPGVRQRLCGVVQIVSSLPGFSQQKFPGLGAGVSK